MIFKLGLQEIEEWRITFILSYCIEESKKRRQELIIMGIDFEKTFDSVNRRVLIKVANEGLQM